MNSIIENVTTDMNGISYNLAENQLGYYLVRNIKTNYVTEDELKHFQVKDNLPRIPNHLWNGIISLFHDYSEQLLEVHVRVLKDIKTGGFVAIVPTQTVTTTTVEYNYSKSILLFAGVLVNYPVDFPNCVDYLQIHSHNKMQVKYPSITDDIDELDKPGLYCVISNINNGKYTCCFTVTEYDGVKSKRYFVPNNQINGLVERLNDECAHVDTFDIIRTDYSPIVNSVINKYINYSSNNIKFNSNKYKLNLPDLELFKKSHEYEKNNITLFDKIQMLILEHGKEKLLDEILSHFHDEELSNYE